MNSLDILTQGSSKLGIALSVRQQEQFRQYYDELTLWNQRANLTRIVRWEEVQRRLFLDSLAVSSFIPQAVLAEGSLLDVGSGAGIPGIPLKIAFPSLAVGLLETVGKKAAFLSHIIETLELEGVAVYKGRAEELAHEDTLREAYDVVVARGVAPLRVLWELMIPFCRVGGLAVAPKGTGIDGEVKAGRDGLGLLGGRLKEVVAVEEGEDGKASLFVLAEKVKQAPSNYPRKSGIPKKHPL